MKLGRYLFLIIIVFIIGYTVNRITLSQDLNVAKGDSYNVFFAHMSRWDKLTLKLYLKLNYQTPPTMYPGVYRFDKPLSYKQFLEVISLPPKPIAVKATFLEGWSSYDYDAMLAKK